MAIFDESFMQSLYLLLIGSGVLAIGVALFTYFLEGRRKKEQNDLEDRRQRQQNSLEDRQQQQQNSLEDRRKAQEIELDHNRKELEIKVDIVSKMAGVIGAAMAPALFVLTREKTISSPAEKDAIERENKDFLIEIYKMEILLTSYSSEDNTINEWKDYTDVLYALKIASSLYFYGKRSNEENDYLGIMLGNINNYFSDNSLIDFPDDVKLKWEHLTTDMTFDPKLWAEITTKVADQSDKITEKFLKSRIKIF
jgi:hypothetical protein